jgi:short-subunit dehydrogenase
LCHKDIKVLLGSRDRERGEEALKKLGNPSNCRSVQLDVTSDESGNLLVGELKDEKVNILINNAGWASKVQPSIKRLPNKLWRLIIGV